MIYLSELLTKWGMSESYALATSFFTCLGVIFFIAYSAHIIFKIYLSRQIGKYLEKKPNIWGRILLDSRLTLRMSHLIPAMIIFSTVPLLSSTNLYFHDPIIKLTQTVMLLYILIACLSVFNALVYIVENIHRRQKNKKKHSIKSYIQVVRILVYFLALIVGVSIIINKSPIALFTGLGAMAAVLLLAFKDSISGFVASVQLSSYDMVRVGDWIVLPKFGADGDVLEISLNTVKVQNFDKTITTLPTSALLSEGMVNWRGMEEAGGRRIKRSIYIDIKSVKFCDPPLLEKLKKLHYLKDYIAAKEKEITTHNAGEEIGKQDNIANGRHLTNLGLYRAYVEKYVSNHPKIHKEFTLLVRHLQPTELGLPLEIYIFTNDINWNSYENIQADIFEHLFPCLDVFDLKIYQR
ncbi:MAG: Miniconductance mechanosensitive channel YbdG [Chlamydiia bacterium]|nr:Miniconductance mechanosensitive channel YbdG [Chlamydiia bacterium]